MNYPLKSKDNHYQNLISDNVYYFFCSLYREELVAYYRAADIALVTPLKDGMNLEPKNTLLQL